MRARDIFALVLVAIITIVGQFLRESEGYNSDTESPRRPPPSNFSNVPWDADTQGQLNGKPSSIRPSEPAWLTPERQSVVEIPRHRRSGTGTAFAVGDGQWLTARHVVDGCDKIGLQYAPKKAVLVRSARNHPNADIALLTTRNSPEPFTLGRGAANGDNGYMIGYPKGAPGAVMGSKIGTTTLKERGRYQTRETADVWSERSRFPNLTGSLGGLSGGPLFTEDGLLAGVVLAESARRGRVITAQPATLKQMLSDSPKTSTAPVPLNEASYTVSAREWLKSLRISKVICRVSK